MCAWKLRGCPRSVPGPQSSVPFRQPAAPVRGSPASRGFWSPSPIHCISSRCSSQTDLTTTSPARDAAHCSTMSALFLPPTPHTNSNWNPFQNLTPASLGQVRQHQLLHPTTPPKSTLHNCACSGAPLYKAPSCIIQGVNSHAHTHTHPRDSPY